MWRHRPDRVPEFIPARLPARLMSWHGNPPHSTSTGPWSASTWPQSTAVMSPRFGTSGQWWARTRAAYWWASGRPCLSGGSYWECQTTWPPRTPRTDRSRPPTPVKSEPMRGPLALVTVLLLSRLVAVSCGGGGAQPGGGWSAVAGGRVADHAEGLGGVHDGTLGGWKASHPGQGVQEADRLVVSGVDRNAPPNAAVVGYLAD